MGSKRGSKIHAELWKNNSWNFTKITSKKLIKQTTNNSVAYNIPFNGVSNRNNFLSFLYLLIKTSETIVEITAITKLIMNNRFTSSK